MTLEYSNLPSGSTTWFKKLIKLWPFGGSMQVDINWPTIQLLLNNSLKLNIATRKALWHSPSLNLSRRLSPLRKYRDTTFRNQPGLQRKKVESMKLWQDDRGVKCCSLAVCHNSWCTLKHTQSLLCGNQDCFLNKARQWSVLAAKKKRSSLRFVIYTIVTTAWHACSFTVLEPVMYSKSTFFSSNM